MPKVSIIVPVYNTVNYLHKCLDSLINQTYRDIEIICFNDSSTDNSLHILQEYASADNRVKIIDSLINVKQGGGRNAGIKSSTGEYIAFVDSDDWVSVDYVKHLCEAIEANNADICQCDFFKCKGNEYVEDYQDFCGKSMVDIQKNKVI